MLERKLVRLADNGQLSPWMLRSWQSARHSDPVAEARQHVREQDRGLRAKVFCFSLCGVGVLYTGLGIVDKSDGMLVAGLITLGFASLAMIACLALAGVCKIELRGAGRETAYGNQLDLFCQWTGVTLEYLVIQDNPELRKLGKHVMIVQLQENQRLEWRNRYVPRGEWAMKEHDGVSMFEFKYRTCRELGTVSCSYNPLYAGAGRVFALAEEYCPCGKLECNSHMICANHDHEPCQRPIRKAQWFSHLGRHKKASSLQACHSCGLDIAGQEHACPDLY